MHLCVISDLLDKSSQDYFVWRCEVATRTGTPLFSSGIFWTGTVSPRPPALSLARPCLCQTPLGPSFAHLLKGNTTKTSTGFSDRDNHWTAQVENSAGFSFFLKIFIKYQGKSPFSLNHIWLSILRPRKRHQQTQAWQGEQTQGKSLAQVSSNPLQVPPAWRASGEGQRDPSVPGRT